MTINMNRRTSKVVSVRTEGEQEYLGKTHFFGPEMTEIGDDVHQEAEWDEVSVLGEVVSMPLNGKAYGVPRRRVQ